MRMGRNHGLFLIAIIIVLLLVGCVTPEKKRQNDEPIVTDSPAVEDEIEQETPFTTSYRVPTGQFKYTVAELEAYRLFTHQFKKQNDNQVISTMQPHILSYFKLNVDPLIEREMPNRNYDNAIFLASILYYKAYLYWVFGDFTEARIIIRDLHELFPKEIQEGSLKHFETGTIPFKQALKILESDLEKSMLDTSNKTAS